MEFVPLFTKRLETVFLTVYLFPYGPEFAPDAVQFSYFLPKYNFFFFFLANILSDIR